MRKTAATRRGSDPCEELHRPIRSLVWQLFGGFVAVVLTLALAGAGHMSLKADNAALKETTERTRELERSLSAIHERLAELRTGQDHLRDDLRYIRSTLDEERKR